MGKVYTVADWYEKIERRKKQFRSTKVANIKKIMDERQNFLKTENYLKMSEQSKKEAKAVAYTVPLEAWLK